MKKQTQTTIERERKPSIASACGSFTEFQEFEINENSNLTFGDGTCPELYFIVNGDHPCPKDCKFYRSVR